MIRIERFKQLLKERIADYQKRYDATQDRLVFGALQEAKDTLEYVEKQFPSLISHYDANPQKVKIKVELSDLLPGEMVDERRVATARLIKDERYIIEEHIMEEWRFQIIETFFQFLVAERENVLKWRESQDMLGAELMVVLPKNEKI